MIRIVTRAEWGARPPTRKPRIQDTQKLRGWAIHFNGPAVTNKDEVKFLRGVQNYHMDSHGWSDIAYSFMIGQSGTIFEGRGWSWDQFANGTDEVAPFDEGGNTDWLSIMWCGGEGQEPTSPVIRNLTNLINDSRREMGVGMRVRPHSAWKHKTCPGPRLTQLANTLDNWVIPIGDAPPTPLPPPTTGPMPDPLKELDMQTAIRADDGDNAIFLSDGITKTWVDNGAVFSQLCWNGMVRYRTKDAAGNYQPFIISRATVDWLKTLGRLPTYDANFSGGRSLK